LANPNLPCFGHKESFIIVAIACIRLKF